MHQASQQQRLITIVNTKITTRNFSPLLPCNVGKTVATLLVPYGTTSRRRQSRLMIMQFITASFPFSSSGARLRLGGMKQHPALSPRPEYGCANQDCQIQMLRILLNKWLVRAWLRGAVHTLLSGTVDCICGDGMSSGLAKQIAGRQRSVFHLATLILTCGARSAKQEKMTEMLTNLYLL
jgi:hypothetical protein